MGSKQNGDKPFGIIFIKLFIESSCMFRMNFEFDWLVARATKQ